MATAPDSTTKKSPPSSPAANRTSPASTARTRPRLLSRARCSSSSRGKAPWRSTASATPAPMAWSLPGTGPALLLVMLHCAGRARLGVVRVEAELLPAAALPQKVPAAVELDLHGTQPVPIAFEGLGVRAVRLLAATEVLLFPHESLDSGCDALVAHG